MARILEAAEWETRARKEEEAARAGRDPRIPPGGSIGPGGIILDANGNPVLGADGKPMYVAMSGAIDLGAAHAELDAAKARLAELKRRQAAGELTPEEEEELRRLEAKIAALEDVLSGKLDLDAAAREAEEIRARILELKRRQAAGELTPEELAELERLEGRLAVLESVLQLATPAGVHPESCSELDALEAAAREAEEIRARILELKRRQAAGELTPEEEEELRRLEARLVDLEKVIESGMDAAAREAEEIRTRILELKRRQAAGELTPEELAELQRLEGRLAMLENSISAGRAAAFGACGVDANGIPIDKNGRPSKPTQRAFRALSLSLSSPWLTNCLLTACPTLAF